MATGDQALFFQQNAADTLLRDSSNLQVLLNMGFPKRRALKALVATGGAGAQVACDWIFAHVKDPTLDQDTPREYILYACPIGPLGIELDEFWQSSLIKCGRNGVHHSFPHVTLCGIFKCKDENTHKLVQVLQDVTKKADTKLQKIGLEYFSSSNYVGLFLEDEAANFLRKLSREFANAAATSADTTIEPHSNKQLHITLAYKFIPNQLQGLEALAKKLDLKKPCRWELRLYSKDSRFANFETLRVLYPFSPASANHLQLMNGDCIFVDSAAQDSKRSMDGYFYGTSWLTGCSGIFPATHVEKTRETETWTIHKVIPIVNHHAPSTDSRAVQRRYSRGADEFHCSGYNSADGLLQIVPQIPLVPEVPPHGFSKIEEYSDLSNGLSKTHLTAQKKTSKPIEAEAQRSTSPLPPPRAPVVNHTATNESPPTLLPREDLYSQVQKPKGQIPVVPKDLQMARRIYIFRHAERVDISFGKGWINLSFDDKGNYHRKNMNMPQNIPKRPGGPKDFHRDSPLTEMGLHQAFLTGQALKQIGASVHNVYVSPSLRCIQTARGILKGLELEKKLPLRVELGLFEWMRWSPGDILICAHAGSLDGVSRELQGLSPRPMTEFVGIVTKVPYCGSVVLEEISSAGIWELIEPPYPPLTHAPNPRFDWKMLVN